MDQNQKQELNINPPAIIVRAASVALIALALWAFIGALKGIREYRFIGAGVSATNTISVSGEGEVFAVPDIATFTLSVTEEAKEVEDAQREATRRMNDIVAHLKGAGIEDRDIKTTNYNVHPRYEFHEVETSRFSPPGRRELVGFEVSQSLTVKVRDTERAGEILSEVGARGVTNVSGLSFTIDDEDALQAEARKMAIDDAKQKSEILARDLSVDIIRIVGFSEGGSFPERVFSVAQALSFDEGINVAESPNLPVGENKIVSNVTVTYEIR